MNKPYLLQKLAPVGVAASILVTSSASAQVGPGGPICYDDLISNVPGTVLCEDKIFSNIDFSQATAILPNESILVIENEENVGILGDYLFIVENEVGIELPANTTAIWSYNVEIDQSLTGSEEQTFFEFLDIDTEVNPLTDIELVKEVTLLDGMNPGEVITLTSTRGNSGIVDISEFMATELLVVDTLTAGSGTPGPSSGGVGFFLSGENSFRQATKPVPEPASILGLLTIAGLGLGLKCKKQSIGIN